MPKKRIENLITDLHEKFAGELTSPEQQKLMLDLRNHTHAMEEAEPIDPSFEDTLTILLEDIELDHPQAAAILREVMDTLKNIGI